MAITPFTTTKLTVSPIAIMTKEGIEQAIAEGLLIDPSKRFPDYSIMTEHLKLDRKILVTKAVLKRYIELNELLWQWYKENTSKRLWEILCSLYCHLGKVLTNEDVKTITFKISAVVEEKEKENDPDNNQVIELTSKDSPNLGYKVCLLKAVIGLAEDVPIVIMLPGEN